MAMGLNTQVVVYDSFDEMGLCDALLDGIKEYGYEKPYTVQQKGIVPVSQGRNVIVQATSEPGKIATYCIGLLQRLKIENSNSTKCECLIISYKGGYVSEIVADMLALGKPLGVKVQICTSKSIYEDPAHVTVGSRDGVFNKLVVNSFLYEDIKMVVFDGIRLKPLVDGVINFFNRYKFLEHNKPVQVCVFFEESMPESHLLGKMQEILEDPVIILTEENQDNDLSLIGIEKHQFVDVEDEDSRVKPLCQIIRKTQSERTKTIIFVSVPGFASLAKKLEFHGLKISATKRFMNQEERNKAVQDFLNDTHVLLTTRVCARDMISDFYNKVNLIVNYGSPGGVTEYNDWLGWFRGVGAVITILEQPNYWWEELVELQDSYKIVFERIFCFCEEEEEEKKRIKAVGDTIKKKNVNKWDKQQHFIYVCGEEVRVGSVLGIIGDALKASWKSVVFVSSHTEVLLLVKEMKKKQKRYKFNFTITDSLEVLNENTDTSKTIVFVTSDDDVGESIMKVPLVINFEAPLKPEDYYHRFSRCLGNGVIVHIGSKTNWFNILGMQTLYDVTVRELPVNFDNLLHGSSYSMVGEEKSVDQNNILDMQSLSDESLTTSFLTDSSYMEDGEECVYDENEPSSADSNPMPDRKIRRIDGGGDENYYPSHMEEDVKVKEATTDLMT